MDKLITITEQEYARLLTRDCKLDAMKDCGVDNWSGYGSWYEDDYGAGMSFDESTEQYVAEKVSSARRKYGTA